MLDDGVVTASYGSALSVRCAIYAACLVPCAVWQVTEAVDEPDLSLKSAGLLERPEAAITTQTAGENIYSSAQKFEDLPLSPELLKVHAGQRQHAIHAVHAA